MANTLDNAPVVRRPRVVAVWLLLMTVEAVHGTVRALWLATWLGDFRARQLRVLSGSLLIVAVATLTLHWLQARTTRALFQVGALWLLLTVAFELSLGRALGSPWSQIAADYDLRRGGLMPIGLIILTRCRYGWPRGPGSGDFPQALGNSPQSYGIVTSTRLSWPPVRRPHICTRRTGLYVSHAEFHHSSRA